MSGEPGDIGSDPLSHMFAWWNAAYGEAGGFSESALARHFSDDVSMWINGEIRAEGLRGLAGRFRTVQATTDHVAIELPFLACFASPERDRIYTRHRVHFRANGAEGTELVGGWAEIRNDRIDRLDFLSVQKG